MRIIPARPRPLDGSFSISKRSRAATPAPASRRIPVPPHCSDAHPSPSPARGLPSCLTPLRPSLSSIWLRQGGWGTVASAGEGRARTRRRAQWSRSFPRRRRGLEKTANWYCRSIRRRIPTVHQGGPSRS